VSGGRVRLFTASVGPAFGGRRPIPELVDMVLRELARQTGARIVRGPELPSDADLEAVQECLREVTDG